ncbi:MAG: hypothetical protein ABEI52_02370 [Halobacteriaceae archaeon]
MELLPADLPLREIILGYALLSVVALPISSVFNPRANLPLTGVFVVLWAVVGYGVFREKSWGYTAAVRLFGIVTLIGLVYLVTYFVGIFESLLPFFYYSFLTSIKFVVVELLMKDHMFLMRAHMFLIIRVFSFIMGMVSILIHAGVAWAVFYHQPEISIISSS